MDITNDKRVVQVLTPTGESSGLWRTVLARFAAGDLNLTRRSAGEHAISSIQRALIFLGYSTTSRGSFSIDGDFGRGTNRAIAQFQFDQNLSTPVDRTMLCYPCSFSNAHIRIDQLPDAQLTLATLNRMSSAIVEKTEQGEVLCGDFDFAITQLNAIHAGKLMTCHEIYNTYGGSVLESIDEVYQQTGIAIDPRWVLSVIKQETGGVIRPRFEQHKLSKYNQREPDVPLFELRYRAMSQGLGQVLGENYKKVGATSAYAMFTSDIAQQIRFILRFIQASPTLFSVTTSTRPVDAEFRRFARIYNGPAYEKHHYHESFESWFNEFSTMVD